MPTLRHVPSRDEIRCPSAVLYFSDFNLFYHLPLASLPLHFVPFTPKYVTSSKSIPALTGCCSDAHGDASLRVNEQGLQRGTARYRLASSVYKPLDEGQHSPLREMR